MPDKELKLREDLNDMWSLIPKRKTEQIPGLDFGIADSRFDNLILISGT